MSDPFLKAIRDWVANGSGLSADSAGRGPAIWTGNRAPRPNAPYIALTLGGDLEASQAWTEVREIPEEEQVPGADVDIAMVGPQVEDLTIEIFCEDELWATVRPERVLRRILAARRLPTVAQALRTAGIGFGPVTAIQTLAIARSEVFEPRARVTIAVHTISEVTERGTTIEQMEFTADTVKNDGGEVLTIPPFITPLPDA